MPPLPQWWWMCCLKDNQVRTRFYIHYQLLSNKLAQTNLSACLSALQSLIVPWETSAWQAARWAKHFFLAWWSWLLSDASRLWRCGWRRSTREGETHWREAVWLRANILMWWDPWYNLNFTVPQRCRKKFESLKHSLCTSAELTMVPAGEYLILHCS